MANNYLQFCEALTGLSLAEADWLMAVAKAGQRALEEGDPISEAAWALWGAQDVYFGTMKREDEEEPGHYQVWFYSEEGDDPEHVGLLVQSFFKKFRQGQAASFILTWADYCSKMRVREFGGGLMVVTEDEFVMHHTRELADSILADFRKKKGAVS
jgi:hypothetical protein